MNILDKINAHKKIEVAQRKAATSIKNLQEDATYKANYQRVCYSLKQSILSGSGIIAEFKRKSPSKGIINGTAKVEIVTVGYKNAGASGLSVLTDTEFFGGTYEDLHVARQHNAIPILRKDFMIDAYQIHEAKAMGADVILLIAASLTPVEVKEFTDIAHDLGLEVLLEVHDETELLQNLATDVDLIGVNNRSLKTFEVSLDVSVQLSKLIPKDKIAVAESGIGSVQDMEYLKKYGYKGFLIGESFMKTEFPHKTLEAFLAS
jgi:indole-3-glycerol phosphate synthase